MPPHFKGKHDFTTMIYNQSGFKFERGCIKLSSKHSSDTLLCFAIPESFCVWQSVSGYGFSGR